MSTFIHKNAKTPSQFILIANNISKYIICYNDRQQMQANK